MWLILTVFAGIGVYRMWASLGKPAQVNWALLPGTIVSEMAYIFGCLITGGEINQAKLVPGKGDSSGGEPKTSDSPRLKVVGPLVSSLLAIVACGAAIILVHRALGKPVMEQFASAGYVDESQLSRKLPESVDEGWELAEQQLRILRRISETWWDLEWSNWRVLLFVYLAICLAVRLGPVSRPIRPTLAAAGLIAGVIAAIGALNEDFMGLMEDIWPLLAYVWASLLAVLAGTLTVRGAVALWKIATGKEKGLKKKG